MQELITSFTALPNLHPAVVHFPIALVVTALAVEALSIFLRRQVWLERCVALLSGLAAVSVVVTYLAGLQAAGSVAPVPPLAEVVLADHAAMALVTMLVIWLAAALRITSSYRDRHRTTARFGWIRALGAALLLTAGLLVGLTADLGGKLVYHHGVAVTWPEQGSS